MKFDSLASRLKTFLITTFIVLQLIACKTSFRKAKCLNPYSLAQEKVFKVYLKFFYKNILNIDLEEECDDFLDDFTIINRNPGKLIPEIICDILTTSNAKENFNECMSLPVTYYNPCFDFDLNVEAFNFAVSKTSFDIKRIDIKSKNIAGHELIKFASEYFNKTQNDSDWATWNKNFFSKLTPSIPGIYRAGLKLTITKNNKKLRPAFRK